MIFSLICPPVSHSRLLELGEELADVFRKRYGQIDYEWGIAGASTDFVCLPFACTLTR